MADLTGTWGGVIETWRTAIANSSAFQTLTSTEDATEAADRVYRVYESSTSARPCAVVFLGEDSQHQSDSMGASIGFKTHIVGSIIVQFESGTNPVSGGDEEDAAATFSQSIFNILADIVNIAGSDETTYQGPVFKSYGPFGSGAPTYVPTEAGAAAPYFRWAWRFNL